MRLDHIAAAVPNLYHGTGYVFEKFRPERSGLIFFTTKRRLAESFAYDFPEPRLLECTVDCNNIFNPRNEQHREKLLDAISHTFYPNGNGNRKERESQLIDGGYDYLEPWTRYIKELGFDGIWMTENVGEFDTLAVFDPQKVTIDKIESLPEVDMVPTPTGYDKQGKMKGTKQSYLSPATGKLDISIIRDARPYALISLDLGIPNFTVFSIKFPLVEDKPNSMSGLVAEAIHVLLDEMSSFMITAGYAQAIIVQVYAATLNCFKGMTGEADTNKSMSPISKDPTVKSFEGTFKLPMSFINETYDKVVTASSSKTLKRPPMARRLELTYDKPSKTTVQDARKVIQNFRSRTIKNQPRPMYIIVYDQWGKATGTIPLGGGSFKNELLQTIYPKGRGKRGAKKPEYTPTVKFDNDIEMKTTNVEGIPKSVYVGDEHFTPYGIIGDDMAIYINEKDEKQEWVVKFTDGRCVSFSDFPSIEELKEGNYPVPTYYLDWTLLDKEDIPESSDAAEAVDEQGNEVIEPSETEVNPSTDLKPDDEKNEQQQDKEKTSAVKKKGEFDDKGYWVGEGGGASGILPICTSTGRLGLAWRSKKVNQGDCWGTIGGGILPDKSPAESARHELMEETGYHGGIRLIPAFVFSDGSFKYHNFIGLVPTEFHLNPMKGGPEKLKFEEETDALKWFSLEELKGEVEGDSGNFHSGLLALFENSGAVIRQIVDAVSNKGVED